MNKQTGGDRSRYVQADGGGQKHIWTNKRVGTEAHMNKTNRRGQKHRTDALKDRHTEVHIEVVPTY